MLALILASMSGEAPDGALFSGVSGTDWEAILAEAKHNDIAQLAADGALRFCSIDDERMIARLKELKYHALTRTMKAEKSLSQCGALLAEEQIPYLPLKGSVLRSAYPEPWMRTGSDVDVLVPAASFDRAVQIFGSQEGVRYKNTTPHDTSFITREGIVLELHHSLIESGRIGKTERLLDRVWDYAEPDQDYAYRLRDEMFYYYHLAHMAKHIERGGCGVRPFIDLWVLDHRLPMNPKREELLALGGLKTFADAAVSLCEHWFGGAEADEDTLLLEDFILRGGVFGNKENEVLVKSANHKGKWGYMLHKIWMPYPFLCCQYPSLKGKKLLLPLYEVRRWARIVFKGNIGFAKDELDQLSRVSDRMPDAGRLWRHLGF
jgi:hypothetical protein